MPRVTHRPFRLLAGLLVYLPLAGMAGESAEVLPVPGGARVHLYADRLVITGDDGNIATVRLDADGEAARPEGLIGVSKTAAVVLFRLDEASRCRLVIVPHKASVTEGDGKPHRMVTLRKGRRRPLFIHLDGWLVFRKEGKEVVGGPFGGRLLALAVAPVGRLEKVLFAHTQYDGRILSDGLPESEAGEEDRWLRLSSLAGPNQWRMFALGEPQNVRAEFRWGNRSAVVPAFRYMPGRVTEKGASLLGRGGYAVRFLVPHSPILSEKPSAETVRAARILMEPAPAAGVLALPLPERLEPQVAGMFPVVVDAGQPRYLVRFDGDLLRPFFPVGRNTAWLKEPLKGYPKLFRDMRLGGENVCRIWSASWHLPIALDRGAFAARQTNALVWDHILLSAARERVKVIMTLSCAYDAVENPAAVPGMSRRSALPQAAAFGRYLSEAAGRFWPFEAVLYFEPMNEPDYALALGLGRAEPRRAYREALRPWLESAVRALRDPTGRPVSCGLSSAEAAQAVGDVLGLEQIHVYLPHTGEEKTLTDFYSAGKVAEALRIASRFGKPVLVGEFGYRPPKGDPHSPDAVAHHNDPEGLALRDALWASIASGAAGPVLPWWWDTYIEKYGLDRRLRAASLFLGSVDIREHTGEVVPVAVPAGMTVVVSRGEKGAVVFACCSEGSGEEVRLLLPAMKAAAKYRVRVFSPESGVEDRAFEAASDDYGRLEITVRGVEAGALLTITQR